MSSPNWSYVGVVAALVLLPLTKASNAGTVRRMTCAYARERPTALTLESYDFFGRDMSTELAVNTYTFVSKQPDGALLVRKLPQSKAPGPDFLRFDGSFPLGVEAMNESLMA